MSKIIFQNIIFLLLFLPIVTKGQLTQKSLRSQVYYLDSNSIQLDSLAIAESSFSITNKFGLPIADSAYKINFKTATITPNYQFGDSVIISYRILQFDFNETFMLKDSTLLIIDSSVNVKPIRFSALPENRDLFGMGGLNKSGSISRGAYFGNNQNLG